MLQLKSKILLFPYWITLKIRHFLYDKGIKKSVSYPIPVICVGNITVGGTGKTPHTEMIIRLLRDKVRIAVLSRGYKRKSKGFRIATPQDIYREIGDEPLQIKQKFPDITLAVCASRREGIERLLKLPVAQKLSDVGEYRPDVIILDDAFQHRHVKPSHSVVLMNYSNPIYNDNLLPIGTLRDLPEQICRANSVIITKSPLFGEHDGFIDQELAEEQFAPHAKVWREKLGLRDDQKLYFSNIFYGEPVGVDPDADTRYIHAKSAIYFTGIANDSEFRDYIIGRQKVVDSLKFPDHCNFTKSDIRSINSWAAKHPTSVVYTTEKDSKRLINNPWLSSDIKKRLFYIPIEVRITPQKESIAFAESLL